MNHEQWEALKAATKYHARGPWQVWLFDSVFSDHKNKVLAAAAPDLLAEVNRLRGWMWMVYMRKQYARHLPRYKYKDMIAQALNGEEVPE